MDNEGADCGLHMQEQNGVSVQNWNPKAGEAVELEDAAQSSKEMITSSMVLGQPSPLSQFYSSVK